MKVLISGAGIAGPTLAYWLDRFGVETTVVEHAPQPRTGGYVIDFWGAGFDIAERMGLLPRLRRVGYDVREVRIVDETGRRVAAMASKIFTRLAEGRFLSLPRGELAAALLDRIGGRVQVRFGDSIAALETKPDGVRALFESGESRDFDLVVGADGLHSRVRELAFGPERDFERYLGIMVAAFEAPGYRPRDEDVYVTYTEVGRQAARFALRGDRTLFLLIFADESGDVPPDSRGRKERIRAAFAASRWECPRILDLLDQADDLYFDRVSQIRMEGPRPWSRGRVALVGDAAFCLSLLAGQGSSLAMTAAYVLAGEIHRSGADPAAGLARYEERLAPFLRRKQGAALRMGGFFAPRSRLALHLRNGLVRLMAIPWIAERAGGELADRIELPAYEPG